MFENKRKREAFATSDIELLTEITKKFSKIVNNSKTNGITPKMKTEV